MGEVQMKGGWGVQIKKIRKGSLTNNPKINKRGRLLGRTGEYSFRMRENKDQKTSNTDAFQAVYIMQMYQQRINR